MSQMNAQIDRLERSIRSLSTEKDSLFDQLQMRQAEVESSQSLLEVLQSQNTELQYQVREKDSRVALLSEELKRVPPGTALWCSGSLYFPRRSREAPRCGRIQA